MPELKERLKIVRGNIAQEEFAEKMQVSKSTVSNYERGVRIPDAEYLIKICKTYNVNPTWLLTGEGGINWRKTELLKRIIKVTDDLFKKWKALSGDKKAEIITFMFEKLEADSTDEDIKEMIDSLIKLAGG